MAAATLHEVDRTPTLADVLTDDIPAARVVLVPTPGTATVADVEAIRLRERRLCELVDGILVEKTVGASESSLAIVLSYFLMHHVLPRRLGVVLGADGTIRLNPNLVRIPDVAYFSRGRLPGGRLPGDAIPLLVPDLAVEVLSPSNTTAEMERKIRDYFEAGVVLVWYLNPRKRIVRVYEAVDRMKTVDETGTLDGGDVLPGFTLRVADWLDAVA